MNKNKRQFLMGMIVNSFGVEEIGEVEEKDIMAKLYGAAKLSNNKELVRRLDKRRNLKGMIANTIYCDIAYLLAEKIVDDETQTLSKLYIMLFEEKYPNIKKMVETSKKDDDLLDKGDTLLKRQHLRFAFYTIMNLHYDLDELDSLLSVAIRTNYTEDLFIDDTESLKRMMEFSDGKNLIETGAFDKYKKRRIEEICEFLGIPTNEFRDYFSAEMLACNSPNGVCVDNTYGSLEYVLSSSIIASHCGAGSWLRTLYARNLFSSLDKHFPVLLYETDMDEVIDSYFIALFYKCVKDDKLENNRVALIRDYKSSSPEIDWIGLCHAYQMDRLVKLTMIILKEYYKNFSWEHITDQKLETKYLKIIDEMKQIGEQQAEKIKKLQNDLETIQMRERSISDKTYISYEQKIKELEKTIREKDAEIKRLKDQSADKDEYIDLLENTDESIDVKSEEIDYEKLAKRKILFVGGKSDIVNKVLSYFSFHKHIGKEYSGTIDVSAVKDVVIFYDFINHGLYYKVINVAREHKLNVIYCHGTNIDNIISNIASRLSE